MLSFINQALLAADLNLAFFRKMVISFPCSHYSCTPVYLWNKPFHTVQ